MDFTSAQITAWIGAYFWPFLRIGAMLMAAPVFGARMVPKRVRLGLGLALAVMVAPLLPAMPLVDALSPDGVLIELNQVVIGLAMGFTLQLVFGALVAAGQTIAMSMGLGFASLVDPQNGVQVPVISQFYLITATLLFLIFNGHLLLIQMVVDSFHTLPVGIHGLPREAAYDMVVWATQMFAGALKVALPAVTAIMLVNLSLGVMTRAAPQMNIFSVGFPITLLGGFVIMIFTMPGIEPQFMELMNGAFALVRDMVSGGAGHG
jgi:flagellar biosynthetic protein FliR